MNLAHLPDQYDVWCRVGVADPMRDAGSAGRDNRGRLSGAEGSTSVVLSIIMAQLRPSWTGYGVFSRGYQRRLLHPKVRADIAFFDVGRYPSFITSTWCPPAERSITEEHTHTHTRGVRLSNTLTADKVSADIKSVVLESTSLRGEMRLPGSSQRDRLRQEEQESLFGNGVGDPETWDSMSWD